MLTQDKGLQADIDAINQISIIPSILNVVCKTTGMGFAAIARVTDEKFITCSTKDMVGFGLGPGDELELETTLCNDVRKTREAILIEDVDNDCDYRDHPVPALYNFKSYISVPIFRKNGSFFGTLCSLDKHPVKVKAEEIKEMFHLFADLISFHLDSVEKLNDTQLRLMEELKTGELREQFIAILGHDLRNPVGTIRMGAEILMESTKEDDTKKVAQLLKGTSFRMENLIGNILDFARGRLGDGIFLTLKPGDKSLEQALLQVIEETKATSPETEIKTEINIDVPVTCDNNRVAQLFSNILSNAIHHGAENAPVTVIANCLNREFKLTVINKGEKIPAGAMKRLFKPFTRQHEKGQKQGLGLGLYIASEIAKAHGGTLSAESSDEETSFSFVMPVSLPSNN